MLPVEVSKMQEPPEEILKDPDHGTAGTDPNSPG